jgi:FkbM family methyltransferase
MFKFILYPSSSTAGFLSSMKGHWNNLVEVFPSISFLQQNLFFQSFSVIYSLFKSQSTHHNHSAYTIPQQIYDFYLEKPSFYVEARATLVTETSDLLGSIVSIAAFQKNLTHLNNFCQENKVTIDSCMTYKNYLEEVRDKREEEIREYDSIKVFKKYQILRDFCKFYPSNILDLGAHIGMWSESMRKSIFPNSSYFLIEGNSDHKDNIQSRNFSNYEITLIGNFTGNISFYRHFNNNFSTGNSIYRENTPYFTGETITMNITTIDEIIERKRKESREMDTVDRKNRLSFQMMKLDIQGGEYDALLGGMKTLQETIEDDNGIELIQTECPLMNYNEGSSLFLELHLLMEKLGFSVFQIVDLLSLDRPQFFVQFDVIWVRKSSKLWNRECTKHFHSFSSSSNLLSMLPIAPLVTSKVNNLLLSYVDRYEDWLK